MSDLMLRYRLRTPTICLQNSLPHPVAILIPAGSVVRLADSVAETAGLVEVEWEGKSGQIFAVDLRDRGELIKAMSATSGAK